MKKSFLEKIITIIFFMVWNLPYFLFLYFVFEYSINLNQSTSVVLAAMFYMDECSNDVRFVNLEDRIKDLEDKLKL